MKAIRLSSSVASICLAGCLVWGMAGASLAQTSFSNTVPIVTVDATAPFAAGPANPGVFTVFRAGSTNEALNVWYELGGSASNGVDYVVLSPNLVAMPAGVTSNTVIIWPLTNSVSPVTKTVILALTNSPLVPPVGYEIGSPSAAVVYLLSSNSPPWFAITSPQSEAVFYTPTNIFITASMGYSYGFPTNLEFFAGTNDLGRGVLEPIAEPAFPWNITWSFVWSNSPPGHYALTAVASFANYAPLTTPPVDITVLQGPATNWPPTVRIFNPTNGETFKAPASVELMAKASDPGGTVTNVEFFAGTNDLGPGALLVLDPPGVNGVVGPIYFLNWPNVAAGTYSLTAVATDNNGASAVSVPVNITVLGIVTNFPPTVRIVNPTNGETFTAPASIDLTALTSNFGYVPVTNVEFFAGSNDLGPGFVSAAVPPFTLIYSLNWSNAAPGTYALTAVATDNHGGSAISTAVNITVFGAVTNISPTVNITSPTNGETFTAPLSIDLTAVASDFGYEAVTNVEFFAGTNDLGPGSVSALVPPFTWIYSLNWSNAAPGTYALTAVATDNHGGSARSTVVKITVFGTVTNVPPVVRITSPPNGAVFRQPVNLSVFAYAACLYGSVTSVEFFADGASLGFGQRITARPQILPDPGQPPVSIFEPTNYWELTWSNAPAGTNIALTAKATDNGGASTVSQAVLVDILSPLLPPTNRPPVVAIVATDPVAIAGTNCWPWPGLTNSVPGWGDWVAPGVVFRWITNCGPKNATFTVLRCGATNDDLEVTYAIDGTASNGVDYVTLPGVVLVPAGDSTATISVAPIDDGPPDINKTVVLRLTPGTNYVVGRPAAAAAVIWDSHWPRATTGLAPGNFFQLSATGPNGAWFHVDYSIDLRNWTPVCTNQVVNGQVVFVDPDSASQPVRFYRAVPIAGPLGQ